MANKRGHRSPKEEARLKAYRAVARPIKRRAIKQKKYEAKILRAQHVDDGSVGCPSRSEASGSRSPESMHTTPVLVTSSCLTSTPSNVNSDSQGASLQLVPNSEDVSRSQGKAHRGHRSKEARQRRRQAYLDSPWPELKRSKAKKLQEQSGEWKDFPLRYIQRRMSELDGLALGNISPQGEQSDENTCLATTTTTTVPPSRWDVVDGRRILVQENGSKFSFTIQGKVTKGVWRWDPPKPEIHCTSCDNPYYSLTLSRYCNEEGVDRPQSFFDAMELLRRVLLQNPLTGDPPNVDLETPIIYPKECPKRHDMGYLLPVQEGGDTRVYGVNGEDIGANELVTSLEETAVEVDFVVQHCAHDGGRRDAVRAVVERIQVLGGVD
ncbi:hypothetical protein BDN72DRAFT_903010 [Pluteus cervinus]|uniref:Uncharacterized protein n=1 Tax=Pluteus cervinus TaxID=181527 RepID=A0ACD3AAH7_9AGAR|nr:hypothetical protein BDN72DRAFT_903010 [Pluteus cervinus]